MRIARVMTRLNLGGPARQALASDSLLQERGHQVRLFCGRPDPGEGDLFAAFEARGLDVVRVPGLRRGPRPVGDWRARRFLSRELRAFQPDVLHTHASKAGLHGRRAAAGLAGLPTVHTFHGHVFEGYFPEPVSRALMATERRLARETRRILAVSHATADDLLRLGVVEEERLVVVQPGIELDPFLTLEGRSGALRAELGVGEEAFLVGVVGRLAAVKRPELALEVFQTLERRYPDLQLVFVGDGPERGRLERSISGGSPSVRERVHLLGARSEMPAVLADLDAVLLTSHSEGMPVALIEAAAAARPVVAMNVGGVAEVVAHERTGFVGEDGDELAYFLAQLLEDPARGAEHGHRARLRIVKRHSARALTDRLEAVYRAAREEVA